MTRKSARTYSRLTLLGALAVVCGVLVSPARSAELVTLSEENWAEYAPAGKEVDCILGDYVLRSDRLTAVVAQAKETRNANMTVKGVGGALIDFTRRDSPNDQLSCYYPHGGAFRLAGPVDWPDELTKPGGSDNRGAVARLAFRLEPREADRGEKLRPTIVLGYELVDGADYLTLRSHLANPHDAPIEVELADGVRADGEFHFGQNRALGLWWCQDDYWPQAYGVKAVGADWRTRDAVGRSRRPRQVEFLRGDQQQVKLAPGESLVLERRLLATTDTFALLRMVSEMAGQSLAPTTIRVGSGGAPVPNATVKAVADEKILASGKTDADGKLQGDLPAGDYQWEIESHGQNSPNLAMTLIEGEANEFEIDLRPVGHVSGAITAEGKGVPCRVAFFGKGVANPHFGPDSAVHGVRNLWHTADGKFEVDLLPGEYELVISRGPEYNAIIKTITVTAGETTEVTGKLVRTVDTTGWLSAELHSHASPSGDNTASQRGRVLNLLVDHLEFIPCTEHQRITTYEPHLKHFAATEHVLTCCGMELTGSPLPLNHQNVFPLIEHSHEQDGGAPTTHPDPEAQIERIAMWDKGSEKVVQINHPNLAQMIGDRDLDGTPDRGFRRMFHFADVIEVHPPELLYAEPEVGRGGWDGRGNPIFAWMQMLNLGYRVPGVVNTDAHWNYYGSGWLRNYVKSSTDKPGEASLAEVCRAIERGQVVMTNGPFLEVDAIAGADRAGPGDDLATGGESPRLRIRVQCPNWLDINRVQVFVNSRPAPEYNFQRSSHPDEFAAGIVKFDQELEITLKEDAHLIVAASGQGKKLGIVYGEVQGETMPIAVSNPIFVDYDGDGFQANGDTLGAPLPVGPGHVPTHGHDHSDGHSHGG